MYNSNVFKGGTCVSETIVDLDTLACIYLILIYFLSTGYNVKIIFEC